MDLTSLKKQYPASTEIKVKWGEMDAFQHLNNTVYIRYFEVGRIDLFEQIGVTSDIKTHNTGPILASVHCDYLAPVTYPDTLIVFSSATQTGPKKVEVEHKLWSTQQKQVVAKGFSVGVYYDYSALKSCIIPDQVAAKLAALKDT